MRLSLHVEHPGRVAPALVRWAVTESIHTRKEIFHNGHPTHIQHH
jgi:hypothetical protein